MVNNIVGSNYAQLLEESKKKVAESRYKAALKVNKELSLLYHHIGSEISKSQQQYGWGAKIIEKLSKDLRNVSP